MSEYHRHIREITPLNEYYLDENGTLQPQRFRYCDICKCIPKTLIAEDPEEERRE